MKIYATDIGSSVKRIFEVAPQGNSKSIAGNGFDGYPYPNANQPAGSQTILATENAMTTVDKQTGLIYGPHFQSMWRIARLNPVSDRWSFVVGTADGSGTRWELADNLAGLSLIMGQTTTTTPLVTGWSLPTMIGLDSSKFIVAGAMYNYDIARPWSALIKSYHMNNNFTQSHLAGLVNVAQPNDNNTNTFCSSGLSKDCMVAFNEWVGQYTRSAYDAVNGRWMVSKEFMTYVTSLGQLHYSCCY